MSDSARCKGGLSDVQPRRPLTPPLALDAKSGCGKSPSRRPANGRRSGFRPKRFRGIKARLVCGRQKLTLARHEAQKRPPRIMLADDGAEPRVQGT